MTRTEIMLAMHGVMAGTVCRTKHLGGDVRQLEAMKDEGLISRERAGGHNWFLSKEQHAALSFIFADPERPTDTGSVT